MMKMSMSFFLTLLGLQSCKSQEGRVLPSQFNQYSVLNTNLKSDNFEVILLSKVMDYGAPNPIRLFHSVNNRVILEESRSDNDNQQGYYYFKLDENANAIDSIYVRLAGGERTYFINEYVIRVRSEGDSDYTTWPLNGNKTPKKMSVLNEDLSWTDEKIVQKEKELVRKSDYYFYDVSYKTNTEDQPWSLQKLFYCLGGKWQILYRPFPKTIRIDERLGYSRYRHDFFRSSDDERPGAIQNFILKYYDKEERLNYDHSIGGGSPSFSVKGWVGVGYFDIPLLKDTLKIKRPNLIVEEATPAIPKTRYYLSNGKNQSVSPFNLNIFTDPTLNFALYSTSKYAVYAIRKKQNNPDKKQIHLNRSH